MPREKSENGEKEKANNVLVARYRKKKKVRTLNDCEHSTTRCSVVVLLDIRCGSCDLRFKRRKKLSSLFSLSFHIFVSCALNEPNDGAHIRLDSIEILEKMRIRFRKEKKCSYKSYG